MRKPPGGGSVSRSPPGFIFGVTLLTLDELLARLASEPDDPIDPASIALRLAVDEYPDLDVESYERRLDEWALELSSIGSAVSADDQTAALAELLFERIGLEGNTDDYYDPRNSYLNEVMDRKLGIPISLSVIAVSVGRRAGWDVAGVGLPGHFIAKVTDAHNGEDVLFDPFHGGQMLTPMKCQELVQAITGRPFFPHPQAFTATPTATIVLRMLNNLKNVYAGDEDFERLARVLGRQRQIDPADPGVARDLGVALVRGGRSGRAIDPLRSYLERMPQADDASDIRSLLLRAERDVSRWN